MKALETLGLILLAGVLILVAVDMMGNPNLATASSVSKTRQYFVGQAQQEAQEAGIPAASFVNQIETESHFNPDAVGKNGEIGIAQFLPSTAAGLGINPHDPLSSLKGAAQMMGRYYREYGDYAKALAGYNCGSGCIARAVRSAQQRGDETSWKQDIPASTRQYISMILGN